MSTGNGFSLLWLRLTGPTAEAAQVDFQPGLNIVWGASNTGKSFIFSCINFMLGREEPPKGITELSGYTTVWLAFAEHSGVQRVLERGKKGGDIRLYTMNGADWSLTDPQALGATHDPSRTDTVSHLLLSVAGFDKTIILTGIEKGSTRQLSFRDIAHATLVHEERIIAEKPPVYPTGQHTRATEELATFTHLITGKEWSGVTANADIKLAKAAWRAKRELYEQLIAELDRDDEGGRLGHKELATEVAAFDRRIASLSSEIDQNIGQLTEVMAARKRAWENKQNAQSRRLMAEQLSERFQLLNQHYKSDLERLRFVSEGDFFLSQLGDPHCPFCGSLLERHMASHLGNESDTSSLQTAAAEEMKKILANMRDLETTQASLAREQGELEENIRINSAQIAMFEDILRRQLEPRVATNQRDLAEMIATRMKMLSRKIALERIAQLETGYAALGKEPKKDKRHIVRASPKPDPASLRLFADEVANILKHWRYLKVGDVEFDTEMDLVVAGEPRRNQGKGHRAVLHSAFSIAIMTHCAKQELNHTGVVLLDSPLTSYKEKDRYETDEDIQIGFYRYLSEIPRTQQVIVFENKEPPGGLTGKFNEIHFSGTAGVGRRGFIPDRR